MGPSQRSGESEAQVRAEIQRLRNRLLNSIAMMATFLLFAFLSCQDGEAGLAIGAAFGAGFELAWALGRFDKFLAACARR